MDSLRITQSTRNSLSLQKNPTGALIIYGRGGDLGSFKVFAECLKKDLSKTFGKNVEIKNIEKKTDFFTYLSATKFSYKIKQLHIFSHAFGSGLALGYGDPIMDQERTNFFNTRFRTYISQNRISQLYDEIIKLEKGILFTDDLFDCPVSIKTAIINQFTPTSATVKIWGCNSGVTDWYYDASDDYWGILNYKRTPKPSIAKTFAEFTKVVTYGAKSGSHVEVLENGVWILSSDYKKKYGKYPSGTLPHRLEPDSGGYDANNP